jgi:hypothetical protein
MLEQFFDETPAEWGSPIEIERRNRIKVSVAAYAYEYLNDSIMSDGDFDALCLAINPKIQTGNKKMDKFFAEVFESHTGQWVHKHPEKNKLAFLYKTYYGKK